MSYFDDASLVMIPSGYKEDKVYSVKPIDGSGDLDFTRASSATRIGSDGNIEKTRTNSILYSNDFDTGFSKTRASLVSGQSGYDGSSDAWGFVDTADNSTHLIVQTVASSEVATFSVYAKAGAVNFIAFRYEDATVDYAYFDLANGILGTIDSDYITAKITSVGNGWYRCEAVRTSANKVVILSAQSDNDPTYAGAGTTAIYIQDAQLEQGLVATSYIETTSTAVTVGSYDNVPRLNYTAGSTSSCPSLLLEPQRTNLITQSEYLGAWDVSAYPVTTSINSIISPDGSLNATLITPTSGNSRHAIRNLSATGVGGTTYTLSSFIKKGVSRYVVFGDAGDSLWRLITVDLDNGTITNENNATGTITAYGNGWYKITCTITRTNSGVIQFSLGASVTNSNSSLPTFDDTSLTIYSWGGQIEEGSYESSYIPTYGATVTRVAETCDKTGISGLIGQTEGTLFADVDFNGLNASISQTALFVRTAGANTGYAFINFYQGKVNVGFRISGSTLFDVLVGSTLSQGRYKIAFAYKSGDLVTYVNGSLTDTRTSTFGTTSFADVHLGGAIGNQLGDGHRQALLFETRLSNTQLAELTS